MKLRFPFLAATLFAIATVTLTGHIVSAETTASTPPPTNQAAKRPAATQGSKAVIPLLNTRALSITWSQSNPKNTPPVTFSLEGKQRLVLPPGILYLRQTPGTAPDPSESRTGSRNLLFTPQDMAKTKTFYPLLTPQTQGRLQMIPAPEPSPSSYAISSLPYTSLSWKAAPKKTTNTVYATPQNLKMNMQWKPAPKK